MALRKHQNERMLLLKQLICEKCFEMCLVTFTQDDDNALTSNQR